MPVDRIVLEIADIVIAGPERRLVCDHHVLAAGCRALDHIEGRHHGGCDPSHGGVLVAGGVEIVQPVQKGG